jgi:hypothetical protein
MDRQHRSVLRPRSDTSDDDISEEVHYRRHLVQFCLVELGSTERAKPIPITEYKKPMGHWDLVKQILAIK